MSELAERAEIVLVDAPAGMFGPTYQLLRASTHVLGVLQAERIADRSFPRFFDALQMMPGPSSVRRSRRRPEHAPDEARRLLVGA